MRSEPRLSASESNPAGTSDQWEPLPPLGSVPAHGTVQITPKFPYPQQGQSCLTCLEELHTGFLLFESQ